MTFNEKETSQLTSLKYRTYLFESEISTYLTLVDLLFAYLYNHRITEGENTVESWWLIAKLSSCLACFDTFTSLRQVLTSSIRRSLVYPLYRNIELSKKCLQDLTVILKLGKKACLKALLEIKRLLDLDDRSFPLSKLWLEDMCIWVQNAKPGMIASLASEVHHFKLDITEIGFPLQELAEVANIAKEEGSLPYDL
jgi:protein SHQ1